MTLRSLPAILAAVLLASCTPQAPAPPAEDADPALWVVRDADTAIYLFGTVHVLKPGIGWFDDGVRAAFDESGELVLELVAPPPAEMSALIRELGEAEAGAPLSQQVPANTAGRVRDALTRLGQRADRFERYEPWLAAVTLSTLQAQALGYDSDEGAEAVLSRAAAKQAKPVTGLETAREQFGYFDGLSPTAQRVLLDEALDAMPGTGNKLDAAIASWSRGDADGLARLVNEDLEASPELTEVLVGARNRRWTDWIAARMQRPGTVFVAVGAGHLAGALGLQAMLAKRGLKVERIVY